MSSLLMRELELERELERRRAQESLLAFTRRTKPDFEVNHHHVAICALMDSLHNKCTARETLNNVGMTNSQIDASLKQKHEVTGLYCGLTNPDCIDLPLENAQVWVSPRTGKTEIISRRAPAAWLGRRPDSSIIACSFGSDLAQQNNRDVQRIMDDELYADVYPDACLSGKNIKTVASGAYLRNSEMFEVVGHKGFYKCAGVGGAIMGRGVNALGVGIIDDPYKSRAQAESVRERQTINDWFFSTYMSRVEANARQVLLNTRWHAADLSAETITRAQTDPASMQWFVLCFPAILDCEPGPGDARTKPGQALWESRYPISRLQQIRASMGEYDFLALHQQRPAAREGALIKISWIERCDVLPADLTDYTLSVDLTFSNTGDFAAFGVYARKGTKHYVVDMIEQRLEFNEQIAMFNALSGKYPANMVKLVENTANGAALMASLKKYVPGIISINPKTSKELRVHAVSPMIEAGNLVVPRAPWADKFITQVCTFPSAAHDDMVDSLSQYLLYVQQRDQDFSQFAGISLGRDDPPAWR